MDKKQYNVNILHEPRKPDGKGWRFFEIGIINVFPASAEPNVDAEPINIQPSIQYLFDSELTKKGGMFSSKLSIPREDEDLDKLLCVEVYGMKCSFQPFLTELKNNGVVDLFGQDLVKLLFEALHRIGSFMKDNTDKPQAIKNNIISMLEVWGNAPLISAMIQICVMRGVEVFLQECLDVLDGYGVAEVQSLLEWVAMEECKLISSFTVLPLTMGAIGQELAEHIKPFTDYLYSTEIGKLANDTTLSCLYGDVDTSNDEPQQEDILPKPKTRPSRKKGRPKDVFSNYISDKAIENWLLPALHQLIDEKGGKNAVLPIAACISMGLITTPTYKAFVDEFGELTSRQNYNKYREPKRHNPVDIDSVKQILKHH